MDFVQAKGLRVESLTPVQAVECMCEFAKTYRVEGLADADDDMLPFQWGTYDWGDGEFFEYNITRQTIDPDPAEDAEGIMQLGVTFRFAPEPFRQFEAGDRWSNEDADIDSFLQVVLASPATGAVRDMPPLSVTLNFEDAG